MGHRSRGTGKPCTPGCGLKAKAPRLWKDGTEESVNQVPGERASCAWVLPMHVGERGSNTGECTRGDRRNAYRRFIDPLWRLTTSAKPCAMKVCAVSRTDGIATRGGRSSRQMTPRRPPHLDPKGRGNNSMVGKREMSEDVYGMVLQRLRDRVRAGLPKPQCPVVEPHTRR